MRLKRFTNANVLRGLGRPLLERFLEKFKTELEEKKVSLPAAAPNDAVYFAEVAKLFLAAADLPAGMIEALHEISELANDAGVERLKEGIQKNGLRVELAEESSHLDLVMQVWLADPLLVTEKHSEHRLVAMTTFEYFGATATKRASFAPPSEEVLALLRRDIDAWCAANQRGAELVDVAAHELEGEFYFLIRHGGTFTRTPKIEKGKTEVLHYRPERDDVVVFSPERDEIRVHAGTPRERQMYQQAFGRRLRGDMRYFWEKKRYVLEPLRQDVEEALSTSGLREIERIALQELEVHHGGDYRDRIVLRSDDLVASAARGCGSREWLTVPKRGELVRAVFEVRFRGTARPRRVYLRPPNVLRLARHGDARAVHEWLAARRFRASVSE